MKNKWMILALILIVASAGLAFGFLSLYFQTQQVIPIPLIEIETVQTGTNTITQARWAAGGSTEMTLNQPWYPMFRPFYDEADWYFYFDDYDNDNTYYLEIKVTNLTIDKVIFPNSSVTGDSKIFLNATQRSDSYYFGPDGTISYTVKPVTGYTYLTCYLALDIPILENITHINWLFIPI